MDNHGLNNEENLKIQFHRDFFPEFAYKTLGKIDFTISVDDKEASLFGRDYLLWAEAKLGNADLKEALVQLILTVGKAKTHESCTPPPFLGAFNSQEVVMVSFHEIMDVFSINDFNWNVTPSDHKSKEFQRLSERLTRLWEDKVLRFNYKKDSAEFKSFIKINFIGGHTNTEKIPVTKNNFVNVFQHWLEQVAPSINIDWAKWKDIGIVEADFFFADLMAENHNTILKDLQTVLQYDKYKTNKRPNDIDPDIFDSSTVEFKDGQKSYTLFWNKYERPPKKEYQDYIIQRRDLCIAQDIRERKGSFFTPFQWVELSQQYLAETLGENWQDEYVIWDCCAGTGNLLTGLTNKYNIWASTLDQSDVDVIKERIKNGAALLESHVFKFDFLNDSFDNLPEGLKEIINDQSKREKFLIYINPPYAEATSSKSIDNPKNLHKPGVSSNKTYTKYVKLIGRGINEVFAQFLFRIYKEIPNCKIGHFSTLKILQSQNFTGFRKYFKADLRSLFLVPADTFDNVKGKFPIGFFIWDTAKKIHFNNINASVYDYKSQNLGTKLITATQSSMVILNWMQNYYDQNGHSIAFMVRGASDFQNNRIIFITQKPSDSVIKYSRTHIITIKNLIHCCIFYAVRKVIPATWINDRDQFLYPNDGWKTDAEFQNNCLTYTLFTNNIHSQYGINHWIPFTEKEVNAKDTFQSRFMTDYIQGKIHVAPEENVLFGDEEKSLIPPKPLVFSKEASEVFEAGRELWQYYHSKPEAIPNAALYDIKAFFQGFKKNEKGKEIMNSSSEDQEYNRLRGNLSAALQRLADQIAPKVYEYGFLLS